MRKVKLLSLYFILVLFGTSPFCQPTFSLTENQKNVISDNCASIKNTLKNVQKTDAHTRVYLGGHFETILSKYIKPLNHRLVENNISNPEIINDQTVLSNAKTKFSNDFITYQKNLEELVAIDCATAPEVFYEKLVTSQESRSVVLSDVNELKSLILQNISSVRLLKEEL